MPPVKNARLIVLRHSRVSVVCGACVCVRVCVCVHAHACARVCVLRARARTGVTAVECPQWCRELDQRTRSGAGACARRRHVTRTHSSTSSRVPLATHMNCSDVRPDMSFGSAVRLFELRSLQGTTQQPRATRAPRPRAHAQCRQHGERADAVRDGARQLIGSEVPARAFAFAAAHNHATASGPRYRQPRRTGT